MSGNLEKLTFMRRFHIDPVYQNYRTIRSHKIDCGVIHREDTGAPYGGEKDWVMHKNYPVIQPVNSLRIPIMDPTRYDPSKQEPMPERYTMQEEVTVDYPGIFLSNTAEAPHSDLAYLEMRGKQRSLKAGSSPYLSAAVEYQTSSTESSDAFAVFFYYALEQYVRAPKQWSSISPNQETYLLYDSVKPNERALPQSKAQYLHLNRVLSNGYLIARISSVTGEYNPLPTPPEGREFLSPDWFSQQTQWAFIKIT